MMSDVLTALLDDLRRNRPMLESYHEFEPWLEAIGQVIAAYPTELRRGACVILVADDLAVATLLPLAEWCEIVSMAVQRRMEVER